MAIDLKKEFIKAQRYVAGSVASACIGGSMAAQGIFHDKGDVTSLALGFVSAGLGVALSVYFGKKAEATTDRAVAVFQPESPAPK